MSFNKRSEIWKHFSTVSDGKAKCSYCLKTISYCGGSTGNLTRHMKTQHKTVSLEKVTYTPTGNNNNVISEQPQETTSITLIEKPQSVHTEPQQLQTASVPTLRQGFKSTYVRRPISVTLSRQLDEQLVRAIVKKYYPFSIVEDKELLFHADPKNNFKFSRPS